MDKISTKEHNRKVIMTFLKESGAIHTTNSVCHAQKAFVINTVLQWVLRKVDSGEYDANDVTFYIQSMNDFLDDNLNVYWSEDGSLVIGT
jgi:hypothetical protein|tara:strand:+ start:182 stop:451 length:270 start_codon:yes stop_codon:yes gene_type:complete